jgi:hypothetical protein
MNHVINHRMSKKQQMRWSPSSANCLLQVRTELLNGTLLGRYRSWHQRGFAANHATRHVPPEPFHPPLP